VPRTRRDGPGSLRRPPSEHADAVRPLDAIGRRNATGADSARRLPRVRSV